MTLTKLFTFRAVTVETTRVLAVLGDREFVLSSLPYVVGRSADEVTLSFSRLLLRFRDTYKLKVEGGASPTLVRHVLLGRRSTIVIEYEARKREIDVYGLYRGPRRWVASKHVRDIAYSLVSEAARLARVRPVDGSGADYSYALSSVSWVSKLVMKSVLVKNELAVIPRGGLVGYVERLVAEKLLERYPVVYVSGSGDRGVFRLLFVDGALRGVYAVVDGREYVGDDRALNALEGLVRVKVYAAVSKPREVLPQ